MPRVPADIDEQRAGIYRKYRVQRLQDPTGKHADCDYFVLDWKHDRFAPAAALAYAKACEAQFPALARDLEVRAHVALSRWMNADDAAEPPRTEPQAPANKEGT